MRTESGRPDFDSVTQILDRYAFNAETPNQQNRMLIELDRRMTPAERKAVLSRWWWFSIPGFSRILRVLLQVPLWRRGKGFGESRSDLVVNFSRWVRRLGVHQRLVGSGGGLNYVRALTTRGLCLYKDDHKANTHLVVGFPGRSKRLMMPVADFLPALEKHGRDLVLLWSPTPLIPRPGGMRKPSTIQETVEELRGFAKEWGYETFSVIGTSGGSLSALYCGAALDARRTAIIGALDPDRLTSDFTWSEVVALWQRKTGGLGGSAKGLSLTFGKDSQKDKEVAESIARDIACRVLSVPEAGHSPLWNLVLRGEFDHWLENVLIATPTVKVLGPTGDAP